MDDLGDLQDIGVKEPHSVGIGEHQTGCVRPHGRAQGVQIHPALGVGGMDTTWNPAMVAEAGLVPWAASGTRILVRALSPGTGGICG